MATPKSRPEPAAPKVRQKTYLKDSPNEGLVFSATADIDEMADKIHENALRHGFHPENQSEDDWFAHMCMNKHAEISEMYDAWRAGKLRDRCDKSDRMGELGLPSLTCLEEEMADLVIRVFDECRRLGVDIANAISIKHRYNLTRPYKHNKLS